MILAIGSRWSNDMKPQIASVSNGFITLCFEDKGSACGPDVVTQEFAESIVGTIKVGGSAPEVAVEPTTTTTTKKKTKKKKAATAE